MGVVAAVAATPVIVIVVVDVANSVARGVEGS